ncbi:hypothetical protein [Xenorhabdus miraniensis]|uniref:Uncharacterized protein n=1 Tax=Xenorhabdus miraniensis TaxID=351674 RepID=A0A2D0JJF6_9GAMM|nr:hypothetical protein [Xenorhabdus miraniensis]PHM45587.1 hypothetical protein Xmir_04266 [Xenorhabdus miraniensis]
MARVITYKDDNLEHLPAGWLSGLVTLCGLSDFSEGDDGGDMNEIHEGIVTCDVCRDMARYG